jgi:signal transduction histidine kinase
MNSLMWILLCLIGCLGGWGGHRFRRQNQTLQRLRHSLRAAHQQIYEQEKVHSQSKTHWAQTEERLRGYLQLLDTLIIGKRPQDLTDQIPADLAAAYQREEIKMIYKAGFHTFETKVQCADGQRREFLFSLAPVMDEEGRLSGSVAVLADLTDKNSALRDRMQKEKLEGVLETAGAVCHELNQPLQALSGYSELIAMRAGGDETLPYARQIISQVDRMRDITQKLQSITRYETTDYAGLTKIIDIHKASAQR